MRLWHQFHDGIAPPHFGFGTEAQARRWVGLRNGQRVANHFELTTLNEGEEPPDDAPVVDLGTGQFRPERYRRGTVRN